MPKTPRRSLISSRELKQGRGVGETYRRIGVQRSTFFSAFSVLRGLPSCPRRRCTTAFGEDADTPIRPYVSATGDKLLMARTPDKPASLKSYRCSREPVVSRPNVLRRQYHRRSEAAFPCKWRQHVAHPL